MDRIVAALCAGERGEIVAVRLAAALLLASAAWACCCLFLVLEPGA